MRRRALLGAIAAAAWVAGCGRKANDVAVQRVPAGATVLALGDSITFGTGAPPEASYPSVLAGLTGWNVVNAGVPGDTSAQALARTDSLLLEHKPSLVLLGIGGNDFLRRLPDDAVQANIRRICEQARAAGAQVLLIAVPRPSLAAAVVSSLSDHPMYEALAAELKLPLHADGWSTVLSDANLRSDQIHANAQGYGVFAQGLLETLRRVGLAG